MSSSRVSVDTFQNHSAAFTCFTTSEVRYCVRTSSESVCTGKCLDRPRRPDRVNKRYRDAIGYHRQSLIDRPSSSVVPEIVTSPLFHQALSHSAELLLPNTSIRKRPAHCVSNQTLRRTYEITINRARGTRNLSAVFTAVNTR